MIIAQKYFFCNFKWLAEITKLNTIWEYQNMWDHFVVTHNFILENTVVAIADIRCIWLRKCAYHENTCSGLNFVLNGLNTLSNMSLCLLNVVLHWVLNLSLHMLATSQTSSPITINSSRWGVISKGKKKYDCACFLRSTTCLH
jgi:hypothetical protein